MTQDAKHLTQRQFGDHAANYVDSPTHARGQTLDRLIETVAPAQGLRVLDVATGGGHTALRMALAGARTVAGDLTYRMLHAARANLIDRGAADAACTVLDAEDLPFAAATFDAVTCRIAPHHFPDVARFVHEMARVTRPGGLVVVQDQLTPGDPQTARYINALERLRDPSHIWSYNRVEWEGFFTGAGLAVEGVETFKMQQHLTDWAERIGCDAPTILRLHAMLRHAPPPVADWLQPGFPAVGDPTFFIRYILIAGRKA